MWSPFKLSSFIGLVAFTPASQFSAGVSICQQKGNKLALLLIAGKVAVVCPEKVLTGWIYFAF